VIRHGVIEVRLLNFPADLFLIHIANDCPQSALSPLVVSLLVSDVRHELDTHSLVQLGPHHHQTVIRSLEVSSEQFNSFVCDGCNNGIARRADTAPTVRRRYGGAPLIACMTLTT